MLVEQLRLVEANVPNVMGGTVICIVAVMLLLDRVLPAALVWPWLALQISVTTWRLWTLVGHRSEPLSTHNVRHRLIESIGHAVLGGTLWGLLGYFGVSAVDPVAGLIVLMILTGLVSGATAVVSHLAVVYYPYTALCLTPAIVHLTAHGGQGARDEYSWVGVLLGFFLLFSWVAARAAGHAVRQSIRLRFEKADLVSGLLEATRTADAERERTADALEREQQANLAKSRFLAAASHDLRQPLHSLRLHASTLRRRTDGTEFERTVAMMEQSVSALDDLFDAILDVSRLDAGTLSADWQHVSLENLLNRLARDLAPQAHERGLELNIASTTAVVHSDATLLERLLRNLLLNAIRYTEHGSVTLDIHDVKGASIRLSIIDTGPGIPLADRERVFEEFVQLGNPERDRSQGIGLGLSIVRRIAGLLKLPVSLEQTPGGGTTVSIELPHGNTEQLAPVPTLEPVDAEIRSMHDLVVLVIDDEEAVRVAMEDFLEERGCIVLAVDSGEEAVATLRESACTPDAIVCDYRLRGSERGTDAIRRVREHIGDEIPGFLVTGDTGATDLREIRDSGLLVLHKPCDPEVLLAGLLEVHRAADVSSSRCVYEA